MSYYDDLILGGIYEQPPSFGQNLNGYADDLIYVGPFADTPVPPTPDVTPTGGGGGKRKKRGRVIRFSDLDERERIEALAAVKVKSFSPIERAAVNLGEADEDDQDDDAILLAAAMRIWH